MEYSCLFFAKVRLWNGGRAGSASRRTLSFQRSSIAFLAWARVLRATLAWATIPQTQCNRFCNLLYQILASCPFGVYIQQIFLIDGKALLKWRLGVWDTYWKRQMATDLARWGGGNYRHDRLIYRISYILTKTSFGIKSWCAKTDKFAMSFAEFCRIWTFLFHNTGKSRWRSRRFCG